MYKPESDRACGIEVPTQVNGWELLVQHTLIGEDGGSTHLLSLMSMIRDGGCDGCRALLGVLVDAIVVKPDETRLDAQCRLVLRGEHVSPNKLDNSEGRTMIRATEPFPRINIVNSPGKIVRFNPQAACQVLARYKNRIHST